MVPFVINNNVIDIIQSTEVLLDTMSLYELCFVSPSLVMDVMHQPTTPTLTVNLNFNELLLAMWHFSLIRGDFLPRSLTRNFIVSVCLSVLMSIEPTSSFRPIFSPGSRGRCHRFCCCCCCSCQPLTHSLTHSLTY